MSNQNDVNEPVAWLHVKNFVQEHIDRCIELYGSDIDLAEEVTREGHEMMRADLMMAVGMLSALATLVADERPQ